METSVFRARPPPWTEHRTRQRAVVQSFSSARTRGPVAAGVFTRACLVSPGARARGAAARSARSPAEPSWAGTLVLAAPAPPPAAGWSQETKAAQPREEGVGSGPGPPRPAAHRRGFQASDRRSPLSGPPGAHTRPSDPITGVRPPLRSAPPAPRPRTPGPCPPGLRGSARCLRTGSRGLN